MKICVINPNSSKQMTADIEATAKSAASDGTEILAKLVAKAPQSIEGFCDGALAACYLTDVVKKSQAEGAEGYIIACFDDTGVDAARECVSGPVIGIGEAAMHVASIISTRFSIITSLERSVPIIEDNGVKYGLMAKCRGVHAFNLPVLAFEKGSEEFDYSLVREKAEQVMQYDRSEALVLGCGGMSHLKDQLAVDLNVPVIDGVSVAIKLIEGLVSLGLATSKNGAYAQPRMK